MTTPDNPVQRAMDELVSLFGARQGGKTTAARCVKEIYDGAIAEGRRQATEGWEREWGVDLHGRGAQCVLDEHAARGIVAGCPDDLDPKVFARLVGRWEPAEQPGGDRG